jgi:flagellar basal-body rod modification protein FlgD
MTTVPPVSSGSSSDKTHTKSNSINDMDMDDFLDLMIAEMQNQDPLNPMENSEMLQQISQMRSVSATDKLTTTLDAVLLGQNVTTASNLIGKEVNAMTDDGKSIAGTVDRVTVTPSEDDNPATVKVHIGDYSVSLGNVREILPGTEST